MKRDKIKSIVKELYPLDNYEKEDVIAMLKSGSMCALIAEVTNQIFRPARKHGYPDKEIEALIDACGEDKDGYSIGCELIGKLERKYYELLKEYDLDEYA